jgi:hypothetical protein
MPGIEANRIRLEFEAFSNQVTPIPCRAIRLACCLIA